MSFAEVVSQAASRFGAVLPDPARPGQLDPAGLQEAAAIAKYLTDQEINRARNDALVDRERRKLTEDQIREQELRLRGDEVGFLAAVKKEIARVTNLRQREIAEAARKVETAARREAETEQREGTRYQAWIEAQAREEQERAAAPEKARIAAKAQWLQAEQQALADFARTGVPEARRTPEMFRFSRRAAAGLPVSPATGFGAVLGGEILRAKARGEAEKARRTRAKEAEATAKRTAEAEAAAQAEVLGDVYVQRGNVQGLRMLASAPDLPFTTRMKAEEKALRLQASMEKAREAAAQEKKKAFRDIVISGLPERMRRSVGLPSTYGTEAGDRARVARILQTLRSTGQFPAEAPGMAAAAPYLPRRRPQPGIFRVGLLNVR